MSEQIYRIEHDSLGDVQVPADALYAAQTQRAVENFPISDLRFPRTFHSRSGHDQGGGSSRQCRSRADAAERSRCHQKGRQGS